MALRVLLVTTCRWIFAGRLVMAFRRAGCDVHLVCPPGHPAEHLRATGRVFPYRGLAPLRSIRAAIEASAPGLVVPCDDLARTQLDQLWSISSPGPLRSLLQLSFGNPEAGPLARSRNRLTTLARENGLPVPPGAPIASSADLRRWIESQPPARTFPFVLKSDGSSGGIGVQIVQDSAQAPAALAKVGAPPLLARAVKRALVNRDFTLLHPSLRRMRPAVSVQSFIPGHDATLTVACWQGQVLASICAEVLHSWEFKGPASVVRIVDSPVMLHTAHTIAARLGLSGICGFDFVVDDETGQPCLIEMNPRATQTAHLQLGPGHDLPAALAAAASGDPVPPAPAITSGDLIALFPLEWERDAASPWLNAAHHDVPWEEPSLMLACARARVKRAN